MRDRRLRLGIRALLAMSLVMPLLGATTASAATASASLKSAPKGPPAGSMSQSQVFADGFESGDLSHWSGRYGLTVQNQDVYAGAWAARASSSSSPAYALNTLGGTYAQLDYALRFKLIAHAGTVTLLKLRTAAGVSVVALNVNTGGSLVAFNAVTRVSHNGGASVSLGRWHLLAVSLTVAGASGTISAWLDGMQVGLSRTDDFGTNPIGVVQAGNSAPGRSYTVDFDEVAVATASQEPPAGAFFGAWVQTADRQCTSSSSQDAALAALESCDGHALGVDREYHKWDDVFPTAHEINSRDAGRTILMSWKAQTRAGAEVPWKDIAAGEYDGAIDARAAGIKSFGATVDFIFHHEPEDEVGKSNGPASDFVAAWKHVHDRFAADGVTNVRWVLDLMTWTFDPASGRNPMDFWPGSAYVDFVGADGYNWYGCRGSSWDSFGTVYSNFYDWSVTMGKPAIAAEWGSTEDPANPSRKAQWIGDAATWVKAHPNMVGLSYFDSPSDCSWWTNTTPQSMAAFAVVAQDPYFQADPSK